MAIGNHPNASRNSRRGIATIAFIEVPERRPGEVKAAYKRATRHLINTHFTVILDRVLNWVGGLKVYDPATDRLELVVPRVGLLPSDLGEATQLVGASSSWSMRCCTQVRKGKKPPPPAGATPARAPAGPLVSGPGPGASVTTASGTGSGRQRAPAGVTRRRSVGVAIGYDTVVRAGLAVGFQGRNPYFDMDDIREETAEIGKVQSLHLLWHQLYSAFLLWMWVVRYVLSWCVQCTLRSADKRMLLLDTWPWEATKADHGIGKATAAFKAQGLWPFFLPAFEDPTFNALMGPHSLYQRLVCDELHLVSVSIGPDSVSGLPLYFPITHTVA